MKMKLKLLGVLSAVLFLLVGYKCLPEKEIKAQPALVSTELVGTYENMKVVEMNPETLKVVLSNSNETHELSFFSESSSKAFQVGDIVTIGYTATNHIKTITIEERAQND